MNRKAAHGMTDERLTMSFEPSRVPRLLTTDCQPGESSVSRGNGLTVAAPAVNRTDREQHALEMIEWLLDTESLHEFLQHLVDDAVASSGAAGCGVTLQRRGRPLTVVSTGGTAGKLDEDQ
jgi:hypothetical protein